MTSLRKIISIVLIFLLIILINTNFVKSVDLNLTENSSSNSSLDDNQSYDEDNSEDYGYSDTT